jgi:hypothetical protein
MIKRGAGLVTLPEACLAPTFSIEHNDFMRITVNYPDGRVRPAGQHMPVDDLIAPDRLAGPVWIKNHDGRARRVYGRISPKKHVETSIRITSGIADAPDAFWQVTPRTFDAISLRTEANEKWHHGRWGTANRAKETASRL